MGDRAQEVEDAWVSVLEYLRSANLDPAKVVGEQDVRAIVGAKVKDPLIAAAVIARWKEVSPSTFGVPGAAPQGPTSDFAGGRKPKRPRESFEPAAGLPRCVKCNGPVDPYRDIIVPFSDLEEFARADRELRQNGTVFIYGPYQTGKTSLAYELKRAWERPIKAAKHAAEESASQSLFRGHAVYARFSEFTGDSTADMWSELGRSVCRAEHIEPPVATPTRHEFVQLLGKVREDNDDYPLLLIIDELDTVACARSKSALVDLLSFIRAEKDNLQLDTRIYTACLCTLAHHEVVKLAPAREGSLWNVGVVVRVGEISLSQLVGLMKLVEEEQGVKFASDAEMELVCSGIHLWTRGHKGLVGYCLLALQQFASSNTPITLAVWEGRLRHKAISGYTEFFGSTVVEHVRPHAEKLRSMLYSERGTIALGADDALVLTRSGLVREVEEHPSNYEFSSPLMQELFISVLYSQKNAMETFAHGKDYSTWDVAGLLKSALRLSDTTVLSSELSRNRNALHERVLSPELHAALKALLPEYHLFPEMHPVANSKRRVDELVSNGEKLLFEWKCGLLCKRAIDDAVEQARSYASALPSVRFALVVNFVMSSSVCDADCMLSGAQSGVNICTIFHDDKCKTWDIRLVSPLVQFA